MQVFKTCFYMTEGKKTMIFESEGDLRSAIQDEVSEIVSRGGGSLSVSIVLTDMTQEQLDALPDFEGL